MTEPLPDHDAEELALLEEQERLDAAYPWVRAWGNLIGLSRAQILEQQRNAAAENAPPIALIRYNPGGERWVLLTDVEPAAYESRLYLLDWGWSRNISVPYEVLKVWLDPNATIPSVILAPDAG